MGVFFAVPPYKRGPAASAAGPPIFAQRRVDVRGTAGAPHGWVCALRPAFDKGPADSPVKTVCALRKNDDDTPAAEKPAAGGRQQSMRGAQN